MLKVSIKDIRKSTGLWKRFQFDGPLLIPDLRLEGEVKLDLRLTNAASRIMVEGPVKAGLRLPCSRCAEEFIFQVESELEESFVPQKEGHVRSEDEAAAPERWNVFTFEEDRLILDEVIRQELLAAVPISPVCTVGCKGLCDSCGQNLNQGACGCQAGDVDPRWAALQKFREGQNH
ncbi:MAG: DUF177 domain-containing protein [Armatimonadetes bacterium]|nr:DUF177 domain-containing protein [Armatimonadota bacterium]